MVFYVKPFYSLLLQLLTLTTTKTYQHVSTSAIGRSSKDFIIRAYNAAYGSIIIGQGVTKVDDKEDDATVIPPIPEICIKDVSTNRQREFTTIETHTPPDATEALPSSDKPMPTYAVTSTTGNFLTGLGKVVWVDMRKVQHVRCLTLKPNHQIISLWIKD